MSTPPTVVAVSGASGYIGTRLLQEMEEQEEPHKLVAIDTGAGVEDAAAFRSLTRKG